jgi:hypothetical protein
MPQKLTHTGMLRRGWAASLGSDHSISLRETKNYWVDQYGTKYPKQGILGSSPPVGSKFPHWVLDLNSIKPI